MDLNEKIAARRRELEAVAAQDEAAAAAERDRLACEAAQRAAEERARRGPFQGSVYGLPLLIVAFVVAVFVLFAVDWVITVPARESPPPLGTPPVPEPAVGHTLPWGRGLLGLLPMAYPVICAALRRPAKLWIAAIPPLALVLLAFDFGLHRTVHFAPPCEERGECWYVTPSLYVVMMAWLLVPVGSYLDSARIRYQRWRAQQPAS